MGPYADEFRAIGDAPPPEPRWDQDWFPRLDAAALYVFVREARPRGIVEIGSGHSTRFMARAVRDGGLADDDHRDRSCSRAPTSRAPAPRSSARRAGTPA